MKNKRLLIINSVKTLFVNLLLILVFFFPVVWIFLTSLKTQSEIYAFPISYWPRKITLENYHLVLRGSGFSRYLINSLIVSLGTTLLVVLLAFLGAYFFARTKLKGRKPLLLFVLMISMFPPIAVAPPLFIFFRKLGLINNYLGLILAHGGLFSPIAVWILTNFLRSVPFELEDAAKVDGCGVLGMIKNVILPLSLPGLAATFLIVFVFSWCEFLLSLVLLNQNALRTAVVGIALYPGEYAFPWELISTATFLALLPIIFFVFVFQRLIIGGLTAGAIK
ncbi:MAG: trehalose/maltose transport system permease protein [Candidatus Atribacteria bacterium]|jgi:multiple sugar transport system permease protein|uniref:carbohydrate ABC transporter permease n=1 Tax=Atrimonas thermophila TaxID=3064161 RepID=UPI0024ABCBC6|nr:trehalose/maltose transport system permease protein [Candidatus Atribacteria bacterium]